MARELARGQCFVSFSGGRDSSAVLAVATSVARREGLGLPIPVTFRFPDVPTSQENQWQEQVIEHLGLTQWERMDLSDELDLLGDTARLCLEAHGPTWPANAYLHMPIFEVARGGVVMTGLDGDGLFGDWRWCHAQAVLHRQVPFHPRDLARIGAAWAPTSVRRRLIRRRGFFTPPWLTGPARDEYEARLVDRQAQEPRRWDRRTRWHGRSRALAVTMASLDALGAPLDVGVVHPLLDSAVLDALATEGGAAGFGDRTSAMRHLCGDLLPARVVERRSKAVFGGAVWREQARTFVAQWDGTGVDLDRVDPQRLRESWQAEHPVFHSWSLLHQAWLAQHRLQEK
jgi:asparagine synthase (glutamine-hydrolysing)